MMARRDSSSSSQTRLLGVLRVVAAYPTRFARTLSAIIVFLDPDSIITCISEEREEEGKARRKPACIPWGRAGGASGGKGGCWWLLAPASTMSAQDLSNLLSLQSLLPQARQAGGNLQAELQQQVIAQRAQQAIMGAAGLAGARNSALISGLQPGGTGMGLPAGFSAAQAQSSFSPIGSSHQRWPQDKVSRANLHTLQHAAAVQAGQHLPQLPQGHDSRMHGMQAQLSVQQSTQIPMHPGFMRTAELPQKPEPLQQQRALEDELVASYPEKKVDKCVPATVETLVPEAQLYSCLLRVEALLDRESAKQAWEVEDALRDKPSLLRTLRMTVCNTHKNQPAMARSAAAKQADSTEAHGETAQGGADRTHGHGGGAPEWTLHIMGDALGVEKSSQKLSDFLEMVSRQAPACCSCPLHVCFRILFAPNRRLLPFVQSD